MFSLILLFFLLNSAVIILELTGSHPRRAPCASRNSISPTPSVFGAPSSVCPEYNRVSPVIGLICPYCSHLILLSPKRHMLYRFFSFATCAVLPASYIVLLFQVPTLTSFLGVRKEINHAASFRLSLLRQHHSSSWERPNLAQGILILVLLSMNTVFFYVGLLALRKPLKTSRKGGLIFGLSFLDCFSFLLVEQTVFHFCLLSTVHHMAFYIDVSLT